MLYYPLKIRIFQHGFLVPEKSFEKIRTICGFSTMKVLRQAGVVACFMPI